MKLSLKSAFDLTKTVAFFFVRKQFSESAEMFFRLSTLQIINTQARD
jgi:hypothetical protein